MFKTQASIRRCVGPTVTHRRLSVCFVACLKKKAPRTRSTRKKRNAYIDHYVLKHCALLDLTIGVSTFQVIIFEFFRERIAIDAQLGRSFGLHVITTG